MHTTSFTKAGAPIDQARLLSQTGDDAALVRELLGLFLEEEGAIWAELEGAALACDVRLLERSAHKLRGALASIGATGAMELAIDIETSSRAGHAASLPTMMQALAIELDRVRQALRRDGSGS
jgi:two-component system, sensor histidine kinase and response regulator